MPYIALFLEKIL